MVLVAYDEDVGQDGGLGAVHARGGAEQHEGAALARQRLERHVLVGDGPQRC